MRLLADENIPRAVVSELRLAGHDVIWVAEALAGSSDADVFVLAAHDERIILTIDKDFGELQQGRRLSSPGIILLRLPMKPPTEIAKHVRSILAARDDWGGHFPLSNPTALECD